MNTLTPLQLRRRFLKIVATTASLWGLGLQGVNAQPAAAKAEKAPEQLRIGYQKSAVNLVILKQKSVLEKRFPNTKITWAEFPAGPQLLEALSVGSLEFGLTGDSPPVFAQAAGKDLVYVGVEPPKPDSSAILVLGDSPIRNLAGLKGKKIALQKGSSAHYLLVRAVDKAGLKWDDIQPIYLAPADARAAFERKSVDAWAIWDPFYAAIELAIKPRVLATGRELSSNNSFYLASRPFATQHAQTAVRPVRRAEPRRRAGAEQPQGGHQAGVGVQRAGRRRGEPVYPAPAGVARGPAQRHGHRRPAARGRRLFAPGPDPAAGEGGRHRLAA